MARVNVASAVIVLSVLIATAAVLLWALVHHVLAGVRHLLMDVGVGSELVRARASARMVLIAAPALALLILVWGLT